MSSPDCGSTWAPLGLLVSTGASHYLISADDVQRAVTARMNRPMFLIDISVPRNIDPAVRHVDNAFLFDIDDLKQRVEKNRAERLQEADKAEQMVVEEVGVLREWMKSLEVTPTIVALKHRADEIKRSELDKTLGRLAHLPVQDRELIEGLASSIVNKLVHGTMVTLKSEVNSSSGAAFVEAARRFFNLEAALPQDLPGVSAVDPSACAAHDASEPLMEQAPSRTTSQKQTQ